MLVKRNNWVKVNGNWQGERCEPDIIALVKVPMGKLGGGV